MNSAALAGGAAAYFGLGLSVEQLGGLLLAAVFIYFADQVDLALQSMTVLLA